MASKIRFTILALLTLWEARANELELSSLSNDNQFPLVGLGVGNLAHESIAAMIGDAVNQGVRLIDTAAASNNERIIAEALANVAGGNEVC